MKKSIIVLLFIFPLFLSAQNDGFLFGVHAGTNTSYISKYLLEDNPYESRLGYEFGFDAFIPIKPNKLYFRTGIEFTAFSEKYENDNLRSGSQHDGMGGFDPDLPGEGKTLKMKFHDFYLDVPIGIRYYFNDSEWRFYTQPSVELTYFLSSHSQSNLGYDDPDIPNRETFSSGGHQSARTLNFIGNLNFGIERNLTETVSISFQTGAGMHILSTSKNSFTGARVYNFNGRFGLSFKL